MQLLEGNPKKVDWKSLFPLTNDDLITVLESTLEFNPYLRKKPEDLLKLDIFAELREEKPESLNLPPNVIQLGVDKKGVFDFSKSQFKKFSIKDLRDVLQNEIDKI